MKENSEKEPSIRQLILIDFLLSLFVHHRIMLLPSNRLPLKICDDCAIASIAQQPRSGVGVFQCVTPVVNLLFFGPHATFSVQLTLDSP